MEKGAVMMKIEKTWQVNIEKDEYRQYDELIHIAGKWGIHMNIYLTSPYEYRCRSYETGIKASFYPHNTKIDS